MSVDGALNTRQSSPALRGGGAGEEAGHLAGQFLESWTNKLLPFKEWNPAREAFTKQAVADLWQRNPNPSKWVAVICYNQAWRVKNNAGISDVADINFKLGSFNTDYDCMFMGRHNQFYTQGNGGFINVSISFAMTTVGF